MPSAFFRCKIPAIRRPYLLYVSTSVRMVCKIETTTICPQPRTQLPPSCPTLPSCWRSNVRRRILWLAKCFKIGDPKGWATSKPNRVDFELDRVDSKPNRVDSKPNRVDNRLDRDPAWNRLDSAWNWLHSAWNRLDSALSRLTFYDLVDIHHVARVVWDGCQC